MEILSIASDAIMRQSERLAASAERVAKMGDGESGADVDLAEEAASRVEANAAVEANLKVIAEENERTKHLLDVIA
jgi:hypothetical protein